MPLASKPISAYRPAARDLMPWSARSRAMKKPPLWEFVFLSMLFHALFITLFGAPSGGSREGRALWGSLQVVLLGAEPQPMPMLKLDRGRTMERLREAPKPRPVPRVEPAAPPVEPPPVQPAPAEAPFSMPPLLDRIVTPVPKLEMAPVLKVPAPSEVQTVRPAAPVIPAPSEKSAAEEPAPRVEQRVPAEPPPIPAPLLQPLPPPVMERLATPPPIERTPVETPVVPALPTTPPVERATVEAPAIPVPRETTVLPKLPPAPERAETPVPPVPPVTPREAPAKIDREPPAIAEPAVRPSPFRAPEPASASTKPRQNEPSTTYDPTAAPTIDLDAVRKRAAAIAREGSGRKAILPFPMPPVPERKTKEQIAIEKARKPDCKTAYQSLGLAAVIPLIANEFGEGNCRW
jgi:hypothetical protein